MKHPKLRQNVILKKYIFSATVNGVQTHIVVIAESKEAARLRIPKEAKKPRLIKEEEE